MMKLPIALKILNVVFAVLFALFSWVQWNDVDPAIYDHPSVLDAVLWGLFYALVAFLFILTHFRPVPRWLLVVGAIYCLIQMGRTASGLYQNLTGDDTFTMTQSSMSAEDPRVELSREFFGAFIALLGVGALAWESGRFRSPPSAPDPS